MIGSIIISAIAFLLFRYIYKIINASQELGVDVETFAKSIVKDNEMNLEFNISESIKLFYVDMRNRTIMIPKKIAYRKNIFYFYLVSYNIEVAYGCKSRIHNNLIKLFAKSFVIIYIYQAIVPTLEFLVPGTVFELAHGFFYVPLSSLFLLCILYRFWKGEECGTQYMQDLNYKHNKFLYTIASNYYSLLFIGSLGAFANYVYLAFKTDDLE